ncbi:helix-turn-helix transcriptional regulator [Marinobacter lacisalsi]|uniref:Helix-turn-helix transcriptional regulator n=1 Tax=Marinobacter lacisalsi TaxID=475979 RepID=A0ABV8QF63_9GAMM
MATPHRQHSSPGPRLYVWNRNLLHLPTLAAQPAPHRVFQDKLLISLDGFLTIVVDGQRLSTRSCLVPAGHWHDTSTVDSRDAVTATWLLQPLSQDHPALVSLMSSAGNGLYYNHPEETRLIRELLDARDAPNPASDRIRQQMHRCLFPDTLASKVFRVYDPRVIRVVRELQRTASMNMPLERFATDVGLSASYLEKLFKEQTGLPVTQYRLRYRIYVASILLGMGYSITDAAHKAGFSSSSHFSRTFRTLTGETASKTFFKSGTETLIDQRALKSVLQVIRDVPASGGRPQVVSE